MELEKKYGLINKWLSLFGDSALFMLNVDIKGTRGPDWANMHTSKFSIETNHDIPYGLFFTPSGNFGKINKPGEKAVRNQQTAEPYVPALFFDLDLKGCEDPNILTVDQLFDTTLAIIKQRRLPVNFLTKSGGGVHGYCMIDPASRIMVGQLGPGKFNLMLDEFANFFPGGDHRVLTMEKLMRCPFSNHWKTGVPIEVELYRVRSTVNDDMEHELIAEKVETPEQMDLDPFDYMPYEAVKSFADSVREPETIRKNNGLILETGSDTDSNVVNKLPVQHVIERLSKYPRVRKMAWGDDIAETSTRFVFDNSHIGFEHTNLVTGEVKREETQGYRINVTENYVHNFTFESHDIKERPRGPVYAFLYHYFDADRQKIKEFLEQEFHIRIFENTADAVMPSIISSNGVIEFTKRNVTYRKEKMGPKGLVKTEQRLFDTPLVIKGVIDSKYSMRGELPNPVKYYVLHRPDAFEHKDIVIEFKENRIKFNQQYGKFGLVFKGQEEDLLDFYLAINNAVHAGQVERFDIAYLNGYRDEYFLMGDKFITPDFRILDKWPNTILETMPVETAFEGKEQVTCAEFGKCLTDLFSDRVAMTSFATYLALFMGTKYWKPLEALKQQLMLPAMMVSGRTMTGKSTLITMLKEGSCLAPKARVKSVRATTPQPLKQAATDPFLLHLEEFTGSQVTQEKESIIRDVINQAKSARGTVGGENIQYEYRASVILDGERMPASRSVVNRMVTLPMFEADRHGTEDGMRAIRKLSFLKDFLTKAYQYSEDDRKEAFMKAEELLSPHMSGRQMMLYSFPLMANLLFDVFPQEAFMKAILENSNTLGQVEVEGDELTTLLSDLFVTRRITGVKHGGWDETDRSYTVDVPIPPEILSEKQVEIVSILKKNSSFVRFANNRMTIKVDGKNEDLINKMAAFEQYMRNRY